MRRIVPLLAIVLAAALAGEQAADARHRPRRPRRTPRPRATATPVPTPVPNGSPVTIQGPEVVPPGETSDFTGHAPARSDVRILVDGVQAASATAGSDGSYTARVRFDGAGTHTLHAASGDLQSDALRVTVVRTYTVFATQYRPLRSGAVEVAVPDKCVKFASLGSADLLRRFACGPGYATSMDWRVYVRRSNGRSAIVRVGDVGPWNIDDNWWDAASGTRPRRMFADLPVGLPESKAALEQGYNTIPDCLNLDRSPSGRSGGADQFDRCVLNRAGIDLSIEAAAAIGLGNLQNDTLEVAFLWDVPGFATRRTRHAPVLGAGGCVMRGPTGLDC